MYQTFKTTKFGGFFSISQEDISCYIINGDM